ncbi:MAG: hypothetical protein K2O14_12570, partial [Oscillospiraceae bacterium]|nr:hypothetical protein [Oscillospiraceae bacterium]
ILCVMMAGCSGDSDNSPSENSVTDFSPAPSLTEPLYEPESTGGENSTAEEFPPAESSEPAAEESVPEETAPPQQTEDAPPADVTKQIAAFDNTFLGLPSADKVYIFSDAGKSAEIDGRVCGAVSCYDEYEGTLYYMCDFYISPDGSRVYRYYEQEERFAILPEEQMTRLDPTRQSLDEIFSKSGRLYDMFHPDTNAAVEGIDYEAEPTEINGEKYLPVTNGQINSKAALLDALDRYFSREIVTALMDTGKFTELDGELYVRNCGGAGSNPTLESIEYELTELTENAAMFTEYDTYRYEAGESEVKEVVYKAEKQNGLWRFTEYTAPWTIH